jgi:hypothetical protein
VLIYFGNKNIPRAAVTARDCASTQGEMHMTSLTQEFIFDALDAEKNGERFPVDFDNVWESFGYSRKDNARKYIAKNRETLMEKGLLQLELSKYHSTDFDKYYLSIRGLKFALARAKTMLTLLFELPK